MLDGYKYYVFNGAVGGNLQYLCVSFGRMGFFIDTSTTRLVFSISRKLWVA
jgi:hypothetical protein